MNIKKSARSIISAAIADMREKKESQCSIYVGDVSSNTIRNYLWGCQHPGETFEYSRNKDGSIVIERSFERTEGLDKPGIIAKLVELHHLQSLAIPVEDLAISVQYAKNVISGASGDGVKSALYIKNTVNQTLYIQCINEKQAQQEHPDRYEDEDDFEIAAQMQEETAQPAAPATTVEDDPDVDWRGQDAPEDDDDEELI